VAFSGVLWSISPLLFGVAVAYAAGGSFFTILLGRRLVWLNFNQADKEAYLRSSLIHLRENAESVVLLQREGRLKARLLRNLDELTDNLKRIITVNRNLSFFTTGYNYMIQIIPALIVAPLFILGRAEFGVITQSAMAFSHLIGAFSLIVNQFGQISSFAAVVARLGSLGEAVEALRKGAPPSIVITRDPDRIVYENLTLQVDGGAALVDRLCATIPRGTNVLISGPNDPAKTALLRATAGVAVPGSGRIIRPEPGELLIVPERPYLPPGTLREVILRTKQDAEVSDERIHELLPALGIEGIPERLGGLDVERDWDDVLPVNDGTASVNLAIERGLYYLYLNQSTDTNGYWNNNLSSNYRSAPTALAVLAFENQGHQPTASATDIYLDTVQRGFNYLCSQLSYSTSISNRPAADTHGVYPTPSTPDGRMVYLNKSENNYMMGMIMMAFAAAGPWQAGSDPYDAGLNPALNLSCSVSGVSLRYYDILANMMDFVAWSQNRSGTGRGSWRYTNLWGSSDNSVSQWPAIGSEAAGQCG
jgi:hypothetical protein